MKIQDSFKNVFTYSAGMEDWCKTKYPNELNYTFCMDFAIADWYGAKDVNETYENVKASWLGDYKAWTEVVIALSMLSFAHDQLRKQGFDGRDEFIRLYSDLYYKAKDDFYDKYEGNEVACDWFFEMTD